MFELTVLAPAPRGSLQDGQAIRLSRDVRMPMTIHPKNFIAGEWVGAQNAAPDLNPSNTNDIVGEFPRGSRADAERAIAAAKDAFPAWSRSTPQERHDVLKRIGDEILARKTNSTAFREEGGRRSPRASARRCGPARSSFFSGETLRMAGDKLCFGAAGHRRGGDPRASRGRRPHHPLELPDRHPGLEDRARLGIRQLRGVQAGRSRAGHSPCPQRDHRPCRPSAGGVQSRHGSRLEVGQALLEHRDVSAISFTGSVQTAAGGCVASDPMKKVQLEMGGKNPLVVLDDADLKTAVECAVNGAFYSTGQRCTASSRIIVTEGIHDRFVQAVSERMRGLVVDDALKAGTQIGPVVDQSQFDQDLSYIRIGQEEGPFAAGGELLDRDAPGFYLAPALFTEADNRMRIAREEIFGPVATVIRVKDYDEALEVANDTPFGLSSGICTTSLKHASHFKRNAEAGMVMVNVPTAGVDYHVPFGGRKGSSYGPREQGRYAQEFYTTVKTAYTFDMNEPYVPKSKASE